MRPHNQYLYIRVRSLAWAFWWQHWVGWSCDRVPGNLRTKVTPLSLFLLPAVQVRVTVPPTGSVTGGIFSFPFHATVCWAAQLPMSDASNSSATATGIERTRFDDLEMKPIVKRESTLSSSADHFKHLYLTACDSKDWAWNNMAADVCVTRAFHRTVFIGWWKPHGFSICHVSAYIHTLKWCN